MIKKLICFFVGHVYKPIITKEVTLFNGRRKRKTPRRRVRSRVTCQRCGTKTPKMTNKQLDEFLFNPKINWSK